MTAVLDAALDYATRGWPVFPLRAKVPAIKGGRGHLDASADGAGARELFRLAPNADGVGVNLEAAGLVLLDVDAKDGGPLTAEGLFLEHGRPTTLQARTGGGQHFYFKRPEGCPAARRIRVWPGVDVLSAGYGVLPPSAHPSGRRYTWHLAPDDVELEDAPAWVVEALRTPERTNGHATVDDAEGPIPDGTRGATFASYAGTMRRRGMDADAIAAALQVVNAKRCIPPMAAERVDKIARSIARYAPDERAAAPVPGRNGKAHDSAALPPQANPTHGSGPRWRVLADVEPMTVEYLWRLRVPLGALTGLIGDPGVGKSSILAAIATRVTLGGQWPGEVVFTPRPPGRVLVLSAEDHVAAVIRPRMEALGADLSRVHVLDGALCLADDEGRTVLEAAIVEFRPALVTVDPVQSYIGGAVDMHRANEVRSVLAPLAALAERHGPAIMLAGHLSKATGTKALYRALGSVDFTAAVRSLLLAGVDPDDEDDRGLVHVKSNYGPIAEPVGFDLRDGTFRWKAATHLTQSAILAMPDNLGSRIEDAEDFLRQELAGGPRPVKALEAAAEAAGLSWATVRNKAKPRVGIIAERVAGVGADGWWEWRLPPLEALDDAKGSKGVDGALSAQEAGFSPTVLSAPDLPLGSADRAGALTGRNLDSFGPGPN